MTRRIALITTLLVLAVAAPAGAQSGAFGPLPPAAPTPTPTMAATNTVDTGETDRTILFIVGGLLIVGFAVMGWYIMRDARAAAPEVETSGPSPRDIAQHKLQKKSKTRARSRTRAQKQARKAHRKR